MIPATNVRTVQTSGAVASGEFGISLDDSAHIMTILRDTLYSDKILAVLREYSSNAWDAHRQAGKPDLPIKVVIPTLEDPTLSIRDFGSGLSREDIFRIYTQYGKSTKRDSDQAVGMLGIGSKSGFAYADSFTITSYFGGTKSTYVAVLDSSDKGVINLLHEEPCGEETGVCIQLAIQPDDIREFQDKAKNLFKYFEPRPECNIEIPDLPKEQSRLKSGVIFHESGWEYSGKWVAVMGCVSYRVDLGQIRNFEEGLPAFVQNLTGALRFDIGEVHINASREELKYSNSTKRALIDKINSLTEEYVRETIDRIEKGNFSQWERRMQSQILQKFSFILPKAFEQWVENSVRLVDPLTNQVPQTFSLYSGKFETSAVRIVREARIILRDDNRTIKGYNLGPYDYVVRREWRDPKKAEEEKKPSRPEWSEVEKELNDLIKLVNIEGIPVKKMSELPWSPPPAVIRFANAKHKLKVFRWAESDADFVPPYSIFWEPVDLTPSDNDVYVNICAFKGLKVSMGTAYKEDAQIAKIFGKKIPKIYGYKVKNDECNLENKRQGIHYNDWRKKFHEDIVAEQKFLDLFEMWKWCTYFDDNHISYRYGYYKPKNSSQYLSHLKKRLGEKHLLYQFLSRKEEYLNKSDKLTEEFATVEKLAAKFPKRFEGKSQAEMIQKQIYDLYPLLTIPEISYSVFKGDHKDKWIDYIKVVDKERKV